MMFRVSHPNIRLFAVQNKIENTILVYPVPSAGRRRFSHSSQWLTPYGPSLRLEGPCSARHQHHHPRHRRQRVARSAADDEIVGIVDDVGIESVPMAMVVPG
jgi:hypothetical protein